MRHQIQPLPIPTQDPRVHLETLQRRDLALEEAADRPERDVVFPFHGADFGGEALFVAGVEALQTRADHAAHVVGAGDVEVGEVGAVGFVQVVVAVVGGVEGGGDHRRKEVAWSAFVLLEEDLVDEAFEDAPLLGGKDMSVGGMFECFVWSSLKPCKVFLEV